jgi:hypothetical protein
MLIDQQGTSVDDLIEAREEAAAVVRSMVTTPNLKGWREWVLHVSDGAGKEIFVLPFAFLLGTPHREQATSFEQLHSAASAKVLLMPGQTR